MKNVFNLTRTGMKGVMSAFLLSIVMFPSCQKEEPKNESVLNLKFSSEYSYSAMEKLRENMESMGAGNPSLPDTNDFILLVKAQDGKVYYNGRYADRPSQLTVPAGTYELSAVSEVFSQPAFSKPVYGDLQVLTVGSSENIAVTFSCTVMNAGMRLKFTPEFQKRFAGADPRLVSEKGSLDYPYTESRIGYFEPSKVSVRLNEQGKDLLIVSRTLNRGEVLTMTLNAGAGPDTGSGHMGITVDTTQVWIEEYYTYGMENDGSSKDKALTIGQIGDFVGMKDVWVKAYIVGGDVSNSAFNNQAPFKSQTHIAVSDNQNPVDRSVVAAVELKSSKIRPVLNLVDNPGNLGRIVYIRGDIEKYYNYPGVKNVDEFELK